MLLEWEFINFLRELFPAAWVLQRVRWQIWHDLPPPSPGMDSDPDLILECNAIQSLMMVAGSPSAQQSLHWMLDLANLDRMSFSMPYSCGSLLGCKLEQQP